MIERLLSTPPHLLQRLASALEVGLLEGTSTPTTVRSVIGPIESLEVIVAALSEFAKLGVSGPAAARWVRSLSVARAESPRIDLVWSGPAIQNLHARDTRQVYEEILSSARQSLWISTYAFYDGPRAFDVLSRRMESCPGLEVTLLLNVQRKRGDPRSQQEVLVGFAERFWGSEWPGTRRPRIFFDPRALDPDSPSGVLHAKAVVADSKSVFVTSANLTEAAWDRNLELGVLLHDRALASSIEAHLRALIDTDRLQPLPEP